jgi:hypothetical protein
LAGVVFAGCHHQESPADQSPAVESSAPEKPMEQSSAQPARVAGLEPGWELAPTAKYVASQTSGEVIIKAMGENPSGGYETKLVMSMLRIWPPQYMLARKKPDGMATAVMTPFEVSASFKATDPIPQVIVTDAAGRHEVKVDQARD